MGQNRKAGHLVEQDATWAWWIVKGQDQNVEHLVEWGAAVYVEVGC